MGILYFLLGLILLIIGIAYIRCLVKRLQCMVSIRLLCRKEGLRLRPARPLWFLGSRYLKRCDFLIEAPGEVFGVKLFGCLWPLKILILREYGEYIFRGFSTYIKFIINFIDSFPHTLPEYRFEHRRWQLPENKQLRRILLVNPIPMEIRFQPNNGLEEISGPGDMIRGMEIANLSHLLRIVENAAEQL